MSIFANIGKKKKQAEPATVVAEVTTTEPVHDEVDNIITTPKPIVTYDSNIATETPMQRAFREAQEKAGK